MESRSSSEAVDKIYEDSKAREAKHGHKWEKVNINEIVDEFAPDSRGRVEKGKCIFEGPRYNVVCDMSSGYLRVYDREKKTHVFLDGRPDKKGGAHYKIKQREEM